TCSPPFLVLAHLAAKLGAIDKHLLYVSQKIADGPVHTQAGGEEPAHVTDHERSHDVHHLLLRLVHAALRHASLREEHGNDDEDRKNVVSIGSGKVFDPQPASVA